MKYTQRQWDREVGWGKVPKEYSMENWNKQFQNEKLPTKLDEYKAKINYDVWADVTNVKYNMEVNFLDTRFNRLGLIKKDLNPNDNFIIHFRGPKSKSKIKKMYQIYKIWFNE